MDNDTNTSDPDNAGSRLGNPPREYSTDSLDAAAWLVCQGFSLLRLDPPDASSSKPHARFIFPLSEELSEAVSVWESGQPIAGTDLRRYISVKKDLYHRARQVVGRQGRSP